MEKLLVPPNKKIHLKAFLLEAGFSYNAYKQLKAADGILVNGEKPLGDMLLEGEEKILLNWVEEPSDIVSYEGDLNILYEDDYLLALDKPAGLLVHPTVRQDEDSLAGRVAHFFRRNNIPAGIHPLSRLDRFTSGVVLFAKKSYIQHALTQQDTEKVYFGIVEGAPEPEEGCITSPIGRKDGSIIERETRPDGKPAETEYKVVGKGKNLSLVRFRLITGRTHQIRVHMASIGHPIYGDGLYGKEKGPQGRHFLHARSISLVHPVTGESLKISAPPPVDMAEILKAEGISYRFYFCVLHDCNL